MNRFFFIFLLCIIAGCNQNKVSSDYYEKIPQNQVSKCISQDRSTDKSKRSALLGVATNSTKQETNTPTDQSVSFQKQMLIKKATLRFEVNKYEEARIKISELIKSANAYVANESESRSDYQISNTMSIRVPQSTFDNLIETIVSQCKNLDERSINVDDVTEEYVDVDSRLKAKREIEKRYLEILKKALSIKDILEVEQKLGEIRQEIESSEGRLKYLSNQVAFSTISLTFYEQKSILPGHRDSVLSRTLLAFANGWVGLIEFLIGLISIWPFFVIVAIIGIVFTKIIRKIKKKLSRNQ